MGLTAESTGRSALNLGVIIRKGSSDDRIIALAGNPNVGKSTVFNALTGLNQHTGNWPGKTVASAQGKFSHRNKDYILVDLPGTYSLMAHSPEEEVARDFICFGNPDVVVVVCDATCLERNMNLVLQTLEVTNKVVVCVNLIDEAKRKGINVDFAQLSENLGVPVIGTSARSHRGLGDLLDSINNIGSGQFVNSPTFIRYPPVIEDAIHLLEPVVQPLLGNRLNSRWVSHQLLTQDQILENLIDQYVEIPLSNHPEIVLKLCEIHNHFEQQGITEDRLKDMITACSVLRAEEVCMDAVSGNCCGYSHQDRTIDHLLTSRWTGIPAMIIMLAGILWLTIIGANYPSQVLSDGLNWIGNRFADFLQWTRAPDWVSGILIDGIYRVLSWVVSVMLPPMAIFFPLFTLLEDVGYLPRVAFNLDKTFQKSCACGKQGLTMCMGLGCNAAGVVGCRIIDSPRERLIATITNNYMPCNGRFPMLIAIITMFFVGFQSDALSSLYAVALLTGAILLGIGMTFLVSFILSKTILRGTPSSFSMELPPYRRPQIGRVIVRSILDRTLFVLGRAVAVAAPAGLIIWIMANVTISGSSLLIHCSTFLDPFAQLLGMDGVILLAFILGFPANEIVIPIIIMTYMATGSITELGSLSELQLLLTNNGWTWLTALCTMLFSLMHWPCSTTCITIRKETQSWIWTAVSFLMPTATGIIICALVASIARLVGLA